MAKEDDTRRPTLLSEAQSFVEQAAGRKEEELRRKDVEINTLVVENATLRNRLEDLTLRFSKLEDTVASLIQSKPSVDLLVTDVENLHEQVKGLMIADGLLSDDIQSISGRIVSILVALKRWGGTLHVELGVLQSHVFPQHFFSIFKRIRTRVAYAISTLRSSVLANTVTLDQIEGKIPSGAMWTERLKKRQEEIAELEKSVPVDGVDQMITDSPGDTVCLASEITEDDFGDSFSQVSDESSPDSMHD